MAIVTSRQLFLIPIIVAVINFAAIIVSDLYTPALPRISEVFAVSESTTSFTVTIFIILMGVSGLFFGPISDQVGRKRVAKFLAICMFIGSVMCSFANDFNTLILGRAIQGIGASIIPVSLATIRDYFKGDRYSAILSQMSMIHALAPVIGPIVGGVLLEFYDWRHNFYLITLVTIAMVFLCFKYYPASPQLPKVKILDFSLREILKDYKALLVTRRFLLLSSISVLAYSNIWIDVGNMPFIIVNGMGFQPTMFGYYMFLGVLSYIIGSFLNQHYVGKYSLHRMLILGLYLMLGNQIIVLIIQSFTTIHPVTLAIIKAPASIGLAFALANSFALALADALKKSGSASALIQFLQLCAAAIGVGITTFFYTGTIIPIVVAAIIINAIAIILYRIVSKKFI